MIRKFFVSTYHQFLNLLDVLAKQIKKKKENLILKLYGFFYDKKPTIKFDSGSIKSIALLRWDDKLGDGIMASAFIALLKKYRPDIKITVITGTVSSHWYRKIFDVDIIICGKRSMATAKSFAQYKGFFDVVIDLGNRFTHVELLAIYHLGAKHNMGHNKNKCKRINLTIDPKYCHFYDRYITAAALFGASKVNLPIPTPPFQENLKNLQAFIDYKHQGKNKVAINFFGAAKYRQFNFTMAKQLLTKWRETFTDDVLMLIPVPGQEKFISALSQEINQPERIIIFPIAPSLENTLAILKLSDFCFTPDTSVVHMASALGVPVLAIYQYDEINYREWKPLNPNSQTIFNRKPLFKKDKVYVHEFDWHEVKMVREKILATI